MLFRHTATDRGSRSLSISVRLYDTQIYGFCSPSASLQLQNDISGCIDDVAAWMRSNRLQLNTAKTEILRSTTGRRLHQLPQPPLRVGSDCLAPASMVRVLRDLEIYLDSDVSMRSHVAKTASACFAVLRDYVSFERPSVTFQIRSPVAHVVIVLSRLDYGNATLAGIPSYLLQQLQSVLNSAARSCSLHRDMTIDHITPLLRQLHWLKALEWEDSVQVCCSRVQVFARNSAVVSRWWAGVHGCPPFAIGPSLLLLRVLGTVCRNQRLWPQHVTSAPSIPVFRGRLKAFLFRRSISHDFYRNFCSACAVRSDSCHFRTL